MDIGSLVITMSADMAELKKGMEDAKTSVGGAMDHINGAIDKTVIALGALGFATSIGSIKDMMMSTIDAAAALNDLSQKTGVTVESLSGLKSAAKLSGTSIEDVAGGLVKLSKSMTDANDKNSTAAASFRALGVHLKEDVTGNLKSADQVMLEVAKSLQGFKDDANKTTTVLNIFGKSGADLLPMLSDLAEKGNLNGKITSEQAQQAEIYTRALAKLKDETDGYIRAVAMEVLPNILKLTDLFVPLVQVTLGFAAAFYVVPAMLTAGAAGITLLAGTMVEAAGATTLLNTTVATLGPTFTTMTATYGAFQATVVSGLALMVSAFAGWKIGEWLSENFLEARLAGIAFVDGTMTGLQYLKFAGQEIALAFSVAWQTAYDMLGEGLAWVLEKVGEGLKMIGLETAGTALQTFAGSILNVTDKTIDFDTESAKLKGQLDANIQSVHAITGGMADEAIAHFQVTQKTDEHKKALKLNTEVTHENREAKEKAVNAGMDFLAAIMAETNKLEAEYDIGKKLTKGQEEQIKLTSELSSGKIKMSKDTEEFTRYLIDENEELASNIKQMQDDNKENDAAVENVKAKTSSIIDATAKLREHRETLGMNTWELANHKIQVELDRAAILDQKAAILEAGGPVTQMSQQLRNQATAVRELAAEMDAVKWAEVTKQIGDGLSAALIDSIRKGRIDWVGFRDYMVSVIVDGAIKSALSGVIQGFIGDMLASFAGVNINIGGMSVAGGLASGLTSAAGSAAAASGGSTLGGAMGTALGYSAGTGFTGTGLTGALGIGASAGAGVTTSAVTGGGPLVATDLGLLGDGAAASGAATAAETTTVGADALALASEWGPWALAAYAVDNLTGNQISNGIGHAVEQVGSVVEDVVSGVSGAIASIGHIFGFAEGGDHQGGLRIVGENGPELEATGPSRIWDASTTASMLRSGGASNAEVLDELRMLRRAFEQAVINTQQTNKTLDRIAPDGDAMSVRVVT